MSYKIENIEKLEVYLIFAMIMNTGEYIFDICHSISTVLLQSESIYEYQRKNNYCQTMGHTDSTDFDQEMVQRSLTN